MIKVQCFRVSGAAWTLEFSADALAVLEKHVQRRWPSRESVGQLYTRDLTKSCIQIERATLLKPSWATYASVRFDPKKMAAERAALFKEGLHCVGLWHSHPEVVPHPSQEDMELAEDHARACQEVLLGLVFVIVGNAAFPSGLGVWVHDGERLWIAECQVPREDA